MDWRDYRKDLERRLAEVKDSLKGWQDGSRFVQSRFGNEPWRDMKPEMIANCERQIKTLEKMIQWAEEQNP